MKHVELITLAAEDIRNIICEIIGEKDAGKRTKLLLDINNKAVRIQEEALQAKVEYERMVRELCVH